MKVGILGYATTKFGELWGVSPRQMARQVITDALSTSDLKLKEIDALYVGNMLSGMLGGQENLGAFFTSELGLTCPAFKIEGACASGGLAVHNAINGVASGVYEKVLVLGIEKMTDYSPSEVGTALMGAGSDQERKAGLTFPGLYALLACCYMEKYGATEEDFATVAVKNHYHATLNPNAHFQFPVTVEKVLTSTKIADPLKLLDCSPVSDGAAAVVIVNEAIARKHRTPVWIAASTCATDSLSVADRADLTTLAATVKAAKRAYTQAGIVPSDIDIAEVHDCFTIAEILALEDLGFFPKGKAGKALMKGETMLGKSKKKLIVNTSGGLKACGHPVGATGVKQVAEIVGQLRADMGKRQIENARVGLTHNVGGSGAVAVVHILTNKYQ